MGSGSSLLSPEVPIYSSYQLYWAQDETKEDAVPRLPNARDLISLPEAAAFAGYRSASTLRKAAHEGTLRTVTLGPRALL